LFERRLRRAILPDDGEPYGIGDLARRLDEMGIKYLVTGWWAFVLRDMTTEEPWPIWFFNDRLEHEEPLHWKFYAKLIKVPRSLLTFGYEYMTINGYRVRVARISRAVLDIAYIFGRFVDDPSRLASILAGFACCCRRNHVYRYIDRYPDYVRVAVEATFRYLDEVRGRRAVSA